MADDTNSIQPPPFPVPAPEMVNELHLAKQLGIPLKKIRALRPVGVETTGDGVFWPRWLAESFAQSVGGKLTLPEKSAPLDATETLVVVSTSRGTDGRHFPNPNVIQCRRANGTLVFVRVVHSKKYRPKLRLGGEPMTVKARPSDVGNQWLLVGREPAHPAQW
jgi:hypothetical protein